MRKPRLCLVFPHVILGGGETATMAVAEGLADDFELEICALDTWDVGDQVTIRDELRTRFARVTFVRERWRLRPILDRAEVVLWYGVTNAVPKALSALDRRPASVRVVHTDREIDGIVFHRRWKKVIDATVCVVPAAARRIPGAVFIPNTCSPRHLQGAAKDFFPRHQEAKTLGFLGRLVPLKNVRWLVENLEVLGCNLLLQALDSKLLTVAELEDLARRRGVESRIRFLPPGRDVGTLLRSIDALVVASSHEGLPRVVIEAGMLAVPVISTRVGGLPELFGDVLHFVDFDGKVPSVAGLRAAIVEIDPTHGERLRQRVSQVCSGEAVIGQYRDLLQDALAEPARAERARR